MNILTNEQTQHIRQTLERRAAQLQLELAAHREARERADAESGVADTKDVADSKATDEMGAAEAERDRSELAQIETALQRLDLGRYGECSDCNESIDASRLLALPAATRCLKCQAQRERTRA